jgi:hypothetical protein
MPAVAGASSDRAAGPPPGRPPFDPPAARDSIRISNVYATAWRWSDAGGGRAAGEAPTTALRLGRLARFYELSDDQLPRVLASERFQPEVVRFNRWREDSCASATAWLFLLPSGQVVAALTLDLRCDLRRTVALLEDCYYEDVTVGGRGLTDLLASLGRGRLQRDDRGDDPRPVLLPERHQLVFMSAREPSDVPDDDAVQRLIYRSDLPYRREFSSIAYPAELNRRPSTVAAVGPYVSVLAGQQDYLENTLFLSAAQAVGAAAKLREIRDDAYRAVGSFRLTESTATSTQQRRRVLSQLAEQLSNLELELSFSVEAGGDLGLLVPSLRTESYHRTLYAAMDLSSRAATVARMLERLDRSIAADLTSVESLERRADEQKRLRWTVVVGFLTTTAAPLGLLFGFFGVNATQVVAETSMFSPRYLWVYLGLAGIVLAGFLLFAALLARERQELRRQRPPRPAAGPDGGTGAVPPEGPVQARPTGGAAPESPA